MYMIMRAVQILALVVFLWGSANDNARNLVGNGAPEQRRGDKRTDHGGK